jgi:hypothetical protein
MAIKLPTFDNVTPIQGGQVVSSAPQFAEAQKVVGNLADIVNKNLQRKADSEAIAQGSLAGENIGFKRTTGFGRATEIYNQAALRSNKYALAADIGNKMSSLGNELGQNVKGNQTLDEFRARAQGYSNGLLASVPAENQEYAKNLLQSHAANQLKVLQNKVNKQNNELAFVDFYKNQQANTDLMSNAAFNGNGPQAIHYKILLHQKVSDGIRAGWLTPVQAKQANLDVDKSFNTNRLLYKYQQAQQANKTFMRGGKTDEAKIMNILSQNSDKNFVQRILHPEGKPTLDIGKGKFATHEMAWQNVNGKSVVFPTVIEDKATGMLKKLSPKDALAHAMEANQFISAKDDKEAAWLSSNYKKIWNVDGKNKNITLKDQYELPTKRFRKIFMKDKSYDKTFSVQDRMGMMSKFDQLDKIEFDKANMTAAHLKNVQDNLLFKVKHGGQADQDKVATLMSVSKDPEDLMHKIDLAKQTWSMVSKHQYDPIDKQVAASSDLKTITPELVAQDAPLDVYNARLNAAEQIDNFKTLRLADPVAQLQNSPVIQHALQQISNGELNITPAQAMVNYQKTLKQPDNKIRTESNLEASTTVQALHQMSQDPAQGDDAVLAALNDKRAGDPGTFHHYFNGLMANGLSPKYQTMMNMWMNPTNRSNIDIYNAAWKSAHTSATGQTLPPGKTGSILDVQVSQHAKLDTKITNIKDTIDTKVQDKMKDFLGTLTTGAADNSKQIQQTTDDVTNVTKYLYAEKGMDLDTATNKAYDMVIGKTFPVITNTYRVPFDVDPDHVKSEMHKMDLAIKRGDTNLKLVAGEGQAFAQEQSRTGFIRMFERRDLFTGGSWINNPNGKGYIKVDVSGNPIYDNKTGKPYGFDTDNMKVVPGVKPKGFLSLTPSQLVGKRIDL